MELTENQIKQKYEGIENKIPSVWETYEKAGIELAQDICFLWDITDAELIRVIALLEMRVKGLKITQHINPMYGYAGLYPHIMQSFDILPDGIEMDENQKNILDYLISERKKNK